MDETPPNRDPVFDEGDNATRTLAENAVTGENVGLPLTATDPDEDTLTYTLSGADAGSFDLNAATGQLSAREGATYDYEAKQTYAVTVTAEDPEGASASIHVTVTLTDVVESTSVALTSLSLDGIALDFASERTEYLVQVAHGVAQTAVRATAGAGGTGVRITVNGAAVEPGAAIPLAVGGNVITVAAVAAGGVVGPLYTVMVTRSAESDTTTASHRWNISLAPASGVRPTDGQTTIAVRVTVECNGSSLITEARCPFEAGSVTFQIQADGSETGEATHRDDFGGPRKPFEVRHGGLDYVIQLNLRPGSGDAEYVPFVLMEEGVGQVAEARFQINPAP